MGGSKQRSWKGRRGSHAASVDKLCLIGLDAEWQRNGDQNHLLSLQWAIRYRGEEVTGITFPYGRRPTMEQLVGSILEDARRKGIFWHYPKAVTLVGHFSLAELSILEDFDKLKTQFDGLRGTFTTLTDPLEVTITDHNRNQRQVSVFLRDSMLLTPQGAKLEVLGEMHGLPKVELPPGTIEDMSGLLRRDPDLFTRYAITDAQIAARHASKMAELNRDLTGLCEVPITLGSLAISFTLKFWRQNDIEIDRVLGREVVTEERFNRATGRKRKYPKKPSIAILHEHEAMAVESYHGGRSEAFCFGPSASDQWIDVDLCGAYSTALASLGMPEWDQLAPTTDVRDFHAGVIGLAWIRFRFPTSVRYPTLPVRISDNLIFPREGETHATSPEIQLAVTLGAEVEIERGFVIPMDLSARPFEAVIAEFTRRRNHAKDEDDDLGNRLYKEMVNSLYGKTAQGLRPKRVFDTRSAEHKDLGPSKLTQPYVAAYVTGLVRAALGELMNAIPPDKTVISVTTDGFITNAGLNALVETSTGPACTILRETRQRLVGEPTILEVKHRAARVLCFRTRGQATLERAEDDQNPLLAKAGIKPPKSVVGREAQNDWIIDQFFNRNPDTTYIYESLRTLRDLYDDGGDLVMAPHERRLSMDFDFKRKPTLRWMEKTENYPAHLAFMTDPFQTVEECKSYRDGWQRFLDRDRCLKTVDDLREFEEFLAGSRLRDHGLNRSQKGLPEVAMRQFLRRLVRGESGLEPVREQYSNKDLARILSSSSQPVTISDLKNAGRASAKPQTGSIPRTPEVMEIVRFLQARFPDWNAEEMLEPGQLPIGQEFHVPPLLPFPWDDKRETG